MIFSSSSSVEKMKEAGSPSHSFLSYNVCDVSRYSHVGKDHLVKLLKQLLLSVRASPLGMVGGNTVNAAAVPTLLGTGSFSLLSSTSSSFTTFNVVTSIFVSSSCTVNFDEVHFTIPSVSQ